MPSSEYYGLVAYSVGNKSTEKADIFSLEHTDKNRGDK